MKKFEGVQFQPELPVASNVIVGQKTPDDDRPTGTRSLMWD